MKAPDKIYISHLCDTTIDGEEGHLMAMSFEDNGGEKYIRKDALLEWLEQEVLKLDVRSDNDAVAWGQRNAFKQAIDKLNSM